MLRDLHGKVCKAVRAEVKGNYLWDYIDFALIVGIHKKTQVLMSAMIVNLYFAIDVQIKNLIISLSLSQQHIAQDVEART